MVISSLIPFHQVDGTKWSDSWWVFTSHQLLKTTQAEALPVVSDFSLVGVGLGCSVHLIFYVLKSGLLIHNLIKNL